MSADATADEPTFRDGIRAGLPLVLPVLLLGVAFGVVARTQGWGVVAPVVMSIVVFSGSAQFAAAAVLAAGGVAAAVLTGTLANLRYLPMGLAAAPATRGGRVRRAAEGQLVLDTSVALAMRGGTVSRGMLLGATPPQAAGWIAGTAIGALAAVDVDPKALGADMVFPAFFLALLWSELGDRGRRSVAALGAAIALFLAPVLPAGLPVPLAALAALVALRSKRKAS
jgi:4-azaleucine resistance transporter AzlC